MTNEAQLRAWLEAARDCLRGAKGIARATDAVLVEQAQGFIGKTLDALEAELLAEGCCQACGSKLRPGERHGSR